MQTRLDRMRAVLTEAFAPEALQLVDDSARHAGHSGAAAGGETHYSVRLVSARFAGQNRVGRSRSVHAVLDGEFRDGLHALSLTLLSPAEADTPSQKKSL